MGQYNVKFSCGHEETIAIFGKNTERQSKIEYFEKQGMCSECYKKMMKDNKNNLHFEILHNLEMTLPTLEGSEKQISWAEKIRDKRLLECKKYDSRNKYEEELKKLTFSLKIWQGTLNSQNSSEKNKSEAKIKIDEINSRIEEINNSDMFTELSKNIFRKMFYETNSKYWIDTREDDMKSMRINIKNILDKENND